MKRIKFNFAILAVVLGLTSVFAFKAPASQNFNPSWEYVGGSTGDPTDPSQYDELSGGPACSGNVNICAIMAPEDPNNPGEPIISSGLSSRISAKNTTAGDVFLQN